MRAGWLLSADRPEISLDEHDPIFQDLYFVLDNEMKCKTELGLGVVKSATPISNNMEEKMWATGVLGEENATQLCETDMYLLGVNLALRGGTELKCLHRPGFNEQLVSHIDEDGYTCLKFYEDPKSKTNQGGIKKRPHALKSVHIYPNTSDINRCPVCLYKKYVSLLPGTMKHGDLFMQSKCRPTPKCWYIDIGAGINTIRQTVNRLCQLAGITGGIFWNQSCRSASVTHLVRGNQYNEKLPSPVKGLAICSSLWMLQETHLY